jgi:hypothetical protein
MSDQDDKQAKSNLTADHFNMRNTRSLSESSNDWSGNKFTRVKSTKKSAQEKSDNEVVSLYNISRNNDSVTDIRGPQQL